MTATGLVSFYKNRYPQRDVENLVKYGKPTLSTISKRDDLEGVKTYIPLQYDSPQGMSADLVKALTNVTSSKGIAWAVDPVADYAGLTIDAKSMMAARSNQGAFFRLREREYESLLDQMGQRFEKALWGDGTGAVGSITADPGTGTTFNLAQPADAINFHEGMVIRFYDSALSERAGGSRVVSKVNEDTGVITVTAALDNAILSSGSVDYVIRDGDLNAMVKGIPAWIPTSDPSATLFFGVDRSPFPQRLGGWRGTWKGTIEETVKALDAKIRRINQKPKTLWLSYSNFNRLDLELGARGVRQADDSSHSFGSTRLLMTTPGGGVEVRTGPYVPETGCWLLTMDTFQIHTLGALPHLVQDDGLSAVRIGGGVAANAVDGIEIRLRAFWQLVCDNPYANGYAPIN